MLIHTTFAEAKEIAWNAGHTEGRTEGRTEEAARLLLTVFRVRGVALQDAARERILAQKDPEQLERWLEKAVLASTVGEVIDEAS